MQNSIKAGRVLRFVLRRSASHVLKHVHAAQVLPTHYRTYVLGDRLTHFTKSTQVSEKIAADTGGFRRRFKTPISRNAKPHTKGPLLQAPTSTPNYISTQNIHKPKSISTDEIPKIGSPLPKIASLKKSIIFLLNLIISYLNS